MSHSALVHRLPVCWGTVATRRAWMVRPPGGGPSLSCRGRPGLLVEPFWKRWFAPPRHTRGKRCPYAQLFFGCLSGRFQVAPAAKVNGAGQPPPKCRRFMVPAAAIRANGRSPGTCWNTADSR